MYAAVLMTLLSAIPCHVAAAQRIDIQNHSFAVITEYQTATTDQEIKKVAIFISNNDCTCQYKAMFGEAVIGEGQIMVKLNPHIIQLGSSKLTINCLPLNDIIVNVE